MAGITRAQFQRLMFPGLREIIYRNYRQKETQYTKIYNVMTSSSAFEEDYTMTGVMLFQRTDEETEVPTDHFQEGLSIRYDMIDYTLRVGFSHQFVRDGKYNIWNDRARDLGFSALQTEEVLHADLYNQGFTNVGYDGVSFFNSSHPLIRGGGSGGQVQSNVLASRVYVERKLISRHAHAFAIDVRRNRRPAHSVRYAQFGGRPAERVCGNGNHQVRRPSRHRKSR